MGGANGDLSFVFAGAGFETTLVDLSQSYQNGPLAASLINLQLNGNVRVIDFSIDGYFSYRNLIDRTVNFGQFSHKSQSEVFDLVVKSVDCWINAIGMQGSPVHCGRRSLY